MAACRAELDLMGLSEYSNKDEVEEGGGEGGGDKKVESKGRDCERLPLRVLNRKR